MDADLGSPGGSGSPEHGQRVVSVVNGRGGVGRTTLASNLAIYARTVATSMPVLVIGLDGAPGIDAMFAPDEGLPRDTIDTALRHGNLDPAIRLGRYGVHYVPSSPDLVARPLDASGAIVSLRQTIRRSTFRGLIILDTAGTLGTLTKNALAISDLCVVPVSDIDSLVSAVEVFDLLASWSRPESMARIVLSMLDPRVGYSQKPGDDMLRLLVARARRLRLPRFQTHVTRSARVQALATNPQGRAFSVLNAANRTTVHRQLGDLAEEVIEALQERPAPASPPVAEPTPRGSREVLSLKLSPRTPEAATALREAGASALSIEDFPFRIGRQDPGISNDLTLPDTEPFQISRKHAYLIRRGERIGVVDLGSRLGTRVDGRLLGGPTADPGPAFFDPDGSTLTLGGQRSPYAFDVALQTGIKAPNARDVEAFENARSPADVGLLH